MKRTTFVAIWVAVALAPVVLVPNEYLYYGTLASAVLVPGFALLAHILERKGLIK